MIQMICDVFIELEDLWYVEIDCLFMSVFCFVIYFCYLFVWVLDNKQFFYVDLDIVGFMLDCYVEVILVVS